MLARASHELLNPLANVLGFVHVLNRRATSRPGDLPADARSNIAMLVGEAERLQTVTEAFIELLRLQDGLFELSASDVEIDQLLHEEVRALRRRWQGLAITEEYAQTAAVARTDGARLRFVVRTVLDCAARSAGGQPSRLAVLPGMGGGARILVYVPVLEAQAAALILGSGDVRLQDGDSDAELDLPTRVTRHIARRLGLTVSLARQAGQHGANIVIGVPATPPAGS